ncbi:MAG TPA: response regulator transcription factor [Thermodesulfovibrionales bacterium]|nr:response regulator transcription factor [Thermodesulfovibrionales bacterium]
MTRVFIADDHAIVRKGLRQIIEETPDIVVAEEAGTSQEILTKVKKTDCDVLLLDIAMPGSNGLEILKQVKLERPDLAVMMLSMHPEEQYAVRSLKAGASGYLTKGSAPAELIDAIRKVSTGRKFISPSLAERLAFDLGGASEKPLHDTLSDREFQVMCMIASGKTVGEIAEELSLSVKTISTYRSRILEKMQMKNNAEITHYALQQRLVD